MSSEPTEPDGLAEAEIEGEGPKEPTHEGLNG